MASGTGFTLASGTFIQPVQNYSALPAANTVPGAYYFCEESQGTWWLPGSLGGTFYNSGLYYSTGTDWVNVEVPFQATQAEVNAGVNNDKFVTPLTLTTWSGLGTYVPYTGATTNVNLGAFNLTTPKIYGGSAVGSTLDLVGTSANGTSSVGAIAFKVGNNGATTAGTIYNNGQFLYGTTTAPGGALAIPFRIGSGTNTIDIGSYSASFAAIWFNQATPGISNFGFLGNSTTTYLNGTSNVYFTIGGTGKVAISSTGMRVGDSTNPSVPLHVVGTGGEPFRVGYDVSNYFRLQIGSTGNVVFAAVGTGGSFTFSNSIAAPYVAKTANYTATISDFTIDCTANSFTVTLPTAVGHNRIYNIINSGSGTITVATTSSQLIGNISPATTFTLNPSEVLNVQSDGANWKLYA